jgi:hypothetical protein
MRPLIVNSQVDVLREDRIRYVQIQQFTATANNVIRYQWLVVTKLYQTKFMCESERQAVDSHHNRTPGLIAAHNASSLSRSIGSTGARSGSSASDVLMNET